MYKTLLSYGGVGGIRTHVPLSTANAFRVRLVMTTSIPLRIKLFTSFDVHGKNPSSKFCILPREHPL